MRSTLRGYNRSNNTLLISVGVKKQQRRLVKAQVKAEMCTTRKEAQEILRKAQKAECKLSAMHQVHKS